MCSAYLDVINAEGGDALDAGTRYSWRLHQQHGLEAGFKISYCGHDELKNVTNRARSSLVVGGRLRFYDLWSDTAVTLIRGQRTTMKICKGAKVATTMCDQEERLQNEVQTWGLTAADLLQRKMIDLELGLSLKKAGVGLCFCV